MNNKPVAVVFGSSGFIGSHLVARLKKEKYFVIGADIKEQKYPGMEPNVFIKHDLTNMSLYDKIIPDNCDELYQLAADMGGASYIFTGVNDSQIMTNSSRINLNTCEWCVKKKVKKVFFSSSACCYNQDNQKDDNPVCTEDSAYPANPDSEYGWEKLFSERLYLAYARNHGLNVRIARYHNVAGPYGEWRGGKEKAPSAICRKVAESTGEIEVFGDGKQTRSFLHIDDCIEGTRRLMKSDFTGPVNIGSEESVSINELVEIVSRVSGKDVTIKHIPGPQGVRGRTSDNRLIREKLGWEPQKKLIDTIKLLYPWIEKKVNESR